MSFKLYEERKENYTFQKIVAIIESIFIIILVVLQINEFESNIWRIVSFIVFSFFVFSILILVLNLIKDSFKWVTRKILRKKGSEDIHYENLKQIINYDELKGKAEQIKIQFGSHLKVEIEEADYFAFYRGLNINITPYSLESGKMKPYDNHIDTWLCKFAENPDTGEIKLLHSDINKEQIIDRPLMDSIENDEWNFTLQPLIKQGWKPIILQSLSLTPNHRFVKFCLRKDYFLFIYKTEDIPIEVILDNF